MIRVLIVAKTRMSSGICIGALTRDDNKNVRLIPQDRHNHPADTKFNVGQIWDLDFREPSGVTPPHIEDMIVIKQKYVGQVTNMRETLMRRVQYWQGDPQELFGRLLVLENTSGYICKSRGLPDGSTGYWLPNMPLILDRRSDKPYYRINYEIGSTGRTLRIPFVGLVTPVQEIPVKTLVRISLARWFRPPGANEDRCYLQLSGWYQ